MCGRFTLRDRIELNAFLDSLGVEDREDFISTFLPGYNIAPTQQLVTVRQEHLFRKRFASPMKWGLIPSWEPEFKTKYSTINAKAENLTDSRLFKNGFAVNRCLIPTDGFYEWKPIEGSKVKQPYFIHRPNDDVFAFAGIYEAWQHDGDFKRSCAIITTKPNATMRPIHNRMPVILSEDKWDAWLDTRNKDQKQLLGFLKPAEDDLLTAYEISTKVNNPKNNTPECVEPIE